MLVRQVNGVRRRGLGRLYRRCSLSLVRTGVVTFLRGGPAGSATNSVIRLQVLSGKGMSLTISLLYRGKLLSGATSRASHEGARLSLLPSYRGIAKAVSAFRSTFCRGLFSKFSLRRFRVFTSLGRHLTSGMTAVCRGKSC